MRSLGSLVLITSLTACSAVGPEAGSDPTPTGGGKADGPQATEGVLDAFDSASALDDWSLATWAAAGVGPLRVERSALVVPVRFTGNGYEQAYLGRGARRSLRQAATLAVDVKLPAGAPAGLRAKLVLLLGPDARWSEPAEETALGPGTTRVALPLAAGLDPVPRRELYDEVRGYGLKLSGTNVSFAGEITVDEVRLEPRAAPSAADLGAVSVGTFGGFQRASGPDIPRENGFLTFSAGPDVGRHRLLWPRLAPGGETTVVGEARFALSPPAAAWSFIDWTTLEATARLDPIAGADLVRATLSRAFPAARYDSDGQSFTWSSARWVAVVLDGRPTVLDLDDGPASLARMSEPWALLLGPRDDGFEVPMLVTFEHRPDRVRSDSGAARFDFGRRAGVVNLMPLFGVRRLPEGTGASWAAGLPADPLNRARVLVPVLAGFPIGCDETYAVDEEAATVAVTDRYTYADLEDDWGTRPLHAAPVPPVVFRAGQMGYPVSYAGAPVETGVATWYGPFAYVAGGEARYTLPLPAGGTRLPVRVRVDGDADAERARAEAAALIRDATPADPMDAFIDNDDRAAAFLAEAMPVLDAPEAEKARGFATRAAEHGFVRASLQELVEPVTGQRYLNNARYWASSEPFDKEWYTGRQLAALGMVADAFGADVARGLWPRALGLYRYDRIFFDWATGSVLSSVFGFTALCDGIHFAWEGMMGTARVARLLGDEATRRDALYRAARQQTALYALWFHAAWTRDIDYGIGHLSHTLQPAGEIETRVAIDGFVEDYGAATLELRSFWQTANYLFFDNVPQLSFYRDFGLEPRVRALEYELMPAAHPDWSDGNVKDPVDDKYYGTEYAAAHLMARAALFHDAPGPLLAIYDASDGSEGSKQWYSMRRFGIGGPTLLAIAAAPAPVVEVPLTLARVESARYDAPSGKLVLALVGRRAGSGVIRTRAAGGDWKETRVSLREGETRTVTLGAI